MRDAGNAEPVAATDDFLMDAHASAPLFAGMIVVIISEAPSYRIWVTRDASMPYETSGMIMTIEKRRELPS